MTMGSVRPVIRYFHSPDVEDFAGFQPEDDEDFGFLLQIMAGPDDGPGEESFDVIVCSPRWFEAQLGAEEVRSGRHYLMMRRYDWPKLEADIRRRVAACEGDDWIEVAEKLSRLGHWEFEDYQPTPP